MKYAFQIGEKTAEVNCNDNLTIEELEVAKEMLSKMIDTRIVTLKKLEQNRLPLTAVMDNEPSAQPEQDIEHCETCIHSTDSEDICILRKCKYAIAELVDCYEPKQPERMNNR